MGSWWARDLTQCGQELSKQEEWEKHSVGGRLSTQHQADTDYPPPPLNGYVPTWKTRSCYTNMKVSNSQHALGKQHQWPQMTRTASQCYLLFWKGLSGNRRRKTVSWHSFITHWKGRKMEELQDLCVSKATGKGLGYPNSEVCHQPRLSFLTKAIMATTLTKCKT